MPMTHIEALFAVEALATLVRARPSGVLIVMTRTSAVVGGAGDQSADGKADKETVFADGLHLPNVAGRAG